MESSVQKYIMIALSVAILFLIVIFVMSPESEEQVTQADAINNQHEPLQAEGRGNTLADVWQWHKMPGGSTLSKESNATVETHESSPQSASLPFTEASVFQALHAVKLDDNNDIILDNDALNALNATLDQPDIQLNAAELEALQNMIRKSLPGEAGEQTARIVNDYYQYLSAKNEFNAFYLSEQSETADQRVDNSLEHYEAQYAELVALRQLYLGDEVAAKLFAESNANSQYMFDTMKLQASAHLSESEKQQAQAELVEKHAVKTTNVDNWGARYQAFLEDKQYIVSASISEREKQAQLNALMHEHFSDQELENVRHLELDSLN
ncbi:MAG: lipase secretion chaperone [Oleiphilus sp.]